MAVTDAQFLAALKRRADLVVLCEIDYAVETAGAPATRTLYFSDRGFVTRPTDSPPSTPYRSRLAKAPKFRRALDRETLGGKAEVSVSECALDNADGGIDFLLDLIVDGHEVRYYVGRDDWPRSDFRLAFAAVLERITTRGESDLILKHRDKRLLLDREVVGSQVGGSGAEADQFLPIIFGSSFNVAARIYDAATATYSVLSNFVAGALAYDVRVAGLTLAKATLNISGGAVTVNAGTDVFTFTAHGLAVDDVVWFKERGTGGVYGDFAPFAGMTSGVQYWVTSVPTADTFTLSATKGGASVDVTDATYLGAGVLGERMLVRRWYDDLPSTGRIRLSSSATGTVTVDLKNSGASGPFSFMQDFIETWGKADADEIDTAAFTAADTAYAAKIGAPYHNYTQHGRGNLLSILDRLSRAAFGWIGQSRDGLVTCGIVDLSGLATAAHSRTVQTSGLRAEITAENDAIGPGRASVNYNANQTPQTDGLVAAVTEENRRRYALPFLGVQRSADYSGTAYSTNPDAYHRTMFEAEPAQLGELTDYVFALSGLTLAFPTDIADEIVADAAPHRRLLSLPCTMELFEAELGEVVRIIHPRYGMADGVNAMIYGVTIDLAALEVDIEAVRISPPDTSDEDRTP